MREKILKRELSIGRAEIFAGIGTIFKSALDVSPNSAKHLVLASQKGSGLIDQRQILIDGDFERYRTDFEPAVLEGDWDAYGRELETIYASALALHSRSNSTEVAYRD